MKLENIEFLIDGRGDITLGRMGPAACAATACDDEQCLVMLVRRADESLVDFLLGLDAAIGAALDGGKFLDEING